MRLSAREIYLLAPILSLLIYLKRPSILSANMSVVYTRHISDSVTIRNYSGRQRWS